MKRLIVLCIMQPALSLSGLCMSTASKDIEITASLYVNTNNGRHLISHDSEIYYANENGSYNRALIPYQSTRTVNRISINNVDLDSTAKLAKIIYCIRLGEGNPAKSYPANIKFGASVTHTLDNGMLVTISLSKTKTGNTISMISADGIESLD